MVKNYSYIVSKLTNSRIINNSLFTRLKMNNSDFVLFIESYKPLINQPFKKNNV